MYDSSPILQVLLIDEISMLGSNLFSTLATIGNSVRQGQSAFGGIQIVTCGDFFQLPPVGLGKFGEDVSDRTASFPRGAHHASPDMAAVAAPSSRQAVDPGPQHVPEG